MQIMFVCTGNTCRSPMAKFLLENLLKEYNRTDIKVLSSGLMPHVNDPLSSHAYTLLLEKHIDGSQHKASLFDPMIIGKNTLILTMSHSHKMHIISQYPNFLFQTFTLTEFVGEKGDIEDPYGGSLENYRHALRELSDLIQKLYLKIK